MTTQRTLQFISVIAILALSFASAGSALAGGFGCANYVTVNAGDTWASLAAVCGTTVQALQAANPTMGSTLYVGQVIYVPNGTPASSYYNVQPSGNTYVVQTGDTLGGIALMFSVTLFDLLAVNPQISNPSLIYPGQVITLPANASAFPNYYATPQVNYGATPFYYNPTPMPSSPFATLRVTYGHGLLVRTGPGINFPEIHSQFVSAVKFSHWQYRKASLTTDSIGFVWVEVQLSPLVTSNSTGWILVRDSLGNYFTEPNLGPRIDPNDP